MRLKTTVYLLFAVAAFGALIWLVDRKAEWQKLWERPSETVLDTRLDEITAFALERGDMKLRCIKMEDTWFIESPIRARANTGVVEKLLSMLESLPKSDVVTLQQREKRDLSMKDYGLLEPRAGYELVDRLGTQRMMIGCDSPVGGLVYVRLELSDDVVAVSRAVLDMMPAGVEDIRDTSVLHGDTMMTSKLEIRQPGGGFIQLVKDHGIWMLRQPVQARADGAKVQQMLDDLFALKVSKFVWDPIVGQSMSQEDFADGTQDDRPREEIYRLAPDVASARIAVWVGGDESGQELILGKVVEDTGKEMYAKKRDVDSVYTVDKDILNTFAVSANDLRSKALFGNRPEDVRSILFERGEKKLLLAKEKDKGWWVVEPVQWKADEAVVGDVLNDITRLTADTFLDGDKDADLSAMGFTPPAFRLLLRDTPVSSRNGDAAHAAGDVTKANGEKRPGDVLLVGGPVKGKPAVFGKFEKDDLIFETASAPLAAIIESAVDPLLYRDRTMLSLNPESIKKITLQKDGTEQTIILSDEGRWEHGGTSTNMPRSEIDQSAVADVLFNVSNLRALRIDSHNPKTKVPYGLEPAPVVLTLGLQGKEGIQKSILFGFLSKTDGVFSMVQGQDVVFVLRNGLVNSLTKSFLKPHPTANEKTKK